MDRENRSNKLGTAKKAAIKVKINFTNIFPLVKRKINVKNLFKEKNILINVDTIGHIINVF